MDVAALSVIMSQQKVHTDAQFAIMGHIKDVAEQQGEQLVELLQQSTPGQNVPHPTLGKRIDYSV